MEKCGSFFPSSHQQHTDNLVNSAVANDGREWFGATVPLVMIVMYYCCWYWCLRVDQKYAGW